MVVLCGASLGASTAFLLGRFVFRDAVAKYKQKYEKFDVIDKVVEQQGLKVTLLLRLSPIIPFSAFNYFMGLTGVSFRDYNIAHVGMIPGTLAYCFIGGTLGAIGDSAKVGLSNPTVLTVTIVGTLIAVIGMIYISYVAKKEFSKIAEQQKEKEMEATDYEAPAPSAPIETSKDVQDDVPENEDDDELYERSVSLGSSVHQ